ncbi:hypothetical protein C2S53_020656 [Perilla frutescens var. hirtella]|uniref:Protein FAR1-RELATED SEQUENCE n=1 Tax=Perilla frutescens var. hirtella TaxID=608512 RepID=A0AAD4IUD4_PERFH|nr:hypothetical protein C2S53_020656 [Perilla frutescens var. hirtella]
MVFDFDLNVSIGSDGCENPNDDPGHNLHAGESDVANEDSTSSLENVDHAIEKRLEAAYSLNVNVIQRPSDYSVDDLEFLVTANGPSTRLRHVFFNKVTNHASCSCHMWETEGIFCRHILNIYFLMNVKSLPEQYMLRRWSKNAKTRILENLSSQSRSHGKHFVTDMVYVNQVMRMTYNRAQESKNHAECRSLIIQRLGDLINELSAKKRDVPVAAPDCGCFRTMLLDKPRGYPNNRLRRLYRDVCQNRGKKKARGGLSGRPLTLNNNTEGTNCNGKATEIDAIRNEAFYATQNSSGGYGASGRYMEETL